MGEGAKWLPTCCLVDNSDAKCKGVQCVHEHTASRVHMAAVRPRVGAISARSALRRVGCVECYSPTVHLQASARVPHSHLRMAHPQLLDRAAATQGDGHHALSRGLRRSGRHNIMSSLMYLKKTGSRQECIAAVDSANADFQEAFGDEPAVVQYFMREWAKKKDGRA